MPGRNLVFSLAQVKLEVSSLVRVNRHTGIPFLAIWIANVVPQVVVPITVIFSILIRLFMDSWIFALTCARFLLSIVSRYHDAARISLNPRPQQK